MATLVDGLGQLIPGNLPWPPGQGRFRLSNTCSDDRPGGCRAKRDSGRSPRHAARGPPLPGSLPGVPTPTPAGVPHLGPVDQPQRCRTKPASEVVH